MLTTSPLPSTGPIVAIVVFVDASLALIELKQRAMGYENRGVDFETTDFAAVAQSLGGHGVTVESREALTAALEAAFAAESFTVIACAIDRMAYDGRL